MPGVAVVNVPGVRQVDTQGNSVDDAIVGVEFLKADVSSAGPTYFCIIDLDNANGGHKHSASGHIELAAFAAVIDKSSSGAQWNAKLGTILAINGSEATIGFLAGGSIIADNTAAFVSSRQRVLFPLTISLEVNAGDYVDFATNNKATNAELTTAVTIEDITGANITPAVGDLVARLERTSGGGDATFAYTAQYRTVA
jgi:hypothetical protein